MTTATVDNAPAVRAAGGNGVAVRESVALDLRSMDEIMRFSEIVSKSKLAPRGMDTPEQIFVAVVMGQEVGLSAMTAIQNTAVINGRPSVWGDAGLAICMASGVFDFAAFEEKLESDPESGFQATSTVRRLPNGKPCTRRFNDKMARDLGCYDKDTYKKSRARMYQWRARWWALRDTFADKLKGIKGAEEIIDLDPIDTEVVSNTRVEPVKAASGFEMPPAAEKKPRRAKREEAPAPEPINDVPHATAPYAPTADDPAQKSQEYNVEYLFEQNIKRASRLDIAPDDLRKMIHEHKGDVDALNADLDSIERAMNQ